MRPIGQPLPAQPADHLKDQLAHTNAHIVSDNTVTSGGCYIKAGNSEIDATMETRWRRVLEAIGVKASEWTKTA